MLTVLTRTILMSAALTAAAVSCTVQETPESSHAAVPVTFSGPAATKGIVPLETANLFTMGVFAGYEDDGSSFGPSSPAGDYIENARYTRSFNDQPFTGEDACYWPFTGRLSFFAYAPYVTDEWLSLADDYVSGYPRFSYAPCADVTRQPDFCLAAPVLDVSPTEDPVQLTFTHTLCQVMFAANCTGTPPSASLHVMVDSLLVSGAIGRKTVSLSAGTPFFSWEDDASCPDSVRTTYVLERRINSQIEDTVLPHASGSNYVQVTAANGLLYLLPQQAGSLTLRAVFGYYETVGGDEILRGSASCSCPLPAAQWQGMHRYRYRFTVDLASWSILNTSVTVVPWEDVDNTSADPVDIE